MLDSVIPAQSLSVTDISDDAVRALVEKINRTGFGCIPRYIDTQALRSMQDFVTDAIEKAGGEYAGFTGRSAVAGSAFDALATTPAFRNLIRRVYEVGTGEPPPEVDFYQVLRCLKGRSTKRHSLLFHYDSYMVTALVPVVIPTSGKQRGDLIMLPNTRQLRSTYLSNVLDKWLLGNKLTQAVLRTLTRWHLLPLVRIRPVPGNLYFFWGYRSIHTNEACDPDKTRATALYHYANPHAADPWYAKRHRTEVS